MTQPLGIDDFFSHEAGEYLERLGVLVSGATAPRPDELVRYARALGSALMANQHLIARAASGMEHVLRAYRDGRRPWDMETATLVAAAVDEMRDLVHHVTKWTPDDSGRAERLAMRLEAMAGPGSGGISGVSEAESAPFSRARRRPLRAHWIRRRGHCAARLLVMNRCRRCCAECSRSVVSRHSPIFLPSPKSSMASSAAATP
jgi:chemotaxis protein histidine kinase CheA